MMRNDMTDQEQRKNGNSEEGIRPDYSGSSLQASADKNGTDLDFGAFTTPGNPDAGGKSGFMDFNITAGVFMVLMIAIVTTLLLCCCKMYVVCRKRRRQRQPGWERRRGRSSTGGRQTHLPIGRRYDDQPPSYADIDFSGSTAPRQLEVAVERGCAGTFSNIAVADPKTEDDAIAVYWSNDVTNDDTSSDVPPPVYSCVVITNGDVTQGTDSVQSVQDSSPPEYSSAVERTTDSVAPRSDNGRGRNLFRVVSLTRLFDNALRTVSQIVARETIRTRERESSTVSNSNQPQTPPTV